VTAATVVCRHRRPGTEAGRCRGPFSLSPVPDFFHQSENPDWACRPPFRFSLLRAIFINQASRSVYAGMRQNKKERREKKVEWTG